MRGKEKGGSGRGLLGVKRRGEHVRNRCRGVTDTGGRREFFWGAARDTFKTLFKTNTCHRRLENIRDPAGCWSERRSSLTSLYVLIKTCLSVCGLMRSFNMSIIQTRVTVKFNSCVRYFKVVLRNLDRTFWFWTIFKLAKLRRSSSQEATALCSPPARFPSKTITVRSSFYCWIVGTSNNPC